MTAGLYVSKLNKLKEELKIVKMGIGVALGQTAAPRIESESKVNPEMFEEMKMHLKKVQGDAIKIAEELRSDKKVDQVSQTLLINDLEGLTESIRKMLKKIDLTKALLNEDKQDPEYEQILKALWENYKEIEKYLPI